MTIGQKLKEARGNISRSEVCKAVGIAYSTLTSYEIDLRVPKDDIKLRLARYYGVSIESLFYS